MMIEKTRPAGLAGFAGVVFAALFVVPLHTFGDWDGQSWWYDTTKCVEPAPASSVSVTEYLDVEARGSDAVDVAIFDANWFWTLCFSDECKIRCTPPRGMMVILK